MGFSLDRVCYQIMSKNAPDEILKMTRCKCLVTHCKNNICSCVKVNLKCTNYCECSPTMCENQRSKDPPSNDSDYDVSDESE